MASHSSTIDAVDRLRSALSIVLDELSDAATVWSVDSQSLALAAADVEAAADRLSDIDSELSDRLRLLAGWVRDIA